EEASDGSTKCDFAANQHTENNNIWRFTMVRSFLRIATIGGVAATLSACGMVYKTTGDVLVKYGSAKMVPHLMETDDVGMACALGESLTPLLLSFESVGSKPDKLGTLVYTTAAACSDERALD